MSRTTQGAAREWALRALARRMHTVREIERGLALRGCASDAIRDILKRLKELGYLDDARFSEMWVSSRSEIRLHGPLRLLSDLRGKGVEEETAKDAVQRLLPKSREIELARRAARKKHRTMRESGIRAAAAMHRHLRSRGFSPEVIRTVVSEVCFEEEEN